MIQYVFYLFGTFVFAVAASNVIIEIRRARYAIRRISAHARTIAQKLNTIAARADEATGEIATLNQTMVVVATMSREVTDHLQMMAGALTDGHMATSIHIIAESARCLPAAIETALQNMKSWSESGGDNLMDDVREFLGENGTPHIIATLISNVRDNLAHEEYLRR